MFAPSFGRSTQEILNCSIDMVSNHSCSSPKDLHIGNLCPRYSLVLSRYLHKSSSMRHLAQHVPNKNLMQSKTVSRSAPSMLWLVIAEAQKSAANRAPKCVLAVLHFAMNEKI